MTKFWELLERSIIVQSLITLILLIAVVYMFVIGRDVSPELYNMLTLVIGFYFGSKVEYTRMNRLINKQ